MSEPAPGFPPANKGAFESAGGVHLWTVAWLVLAVAHVTQAIWWSGFTAVPGDLVDGRFNALVLEHGYQALRGLYDFFSPGQFYPETGTLGLSDTHVGTLPIYAVLRVLGCSDMLAWQGWFVIVAALVAVEEGVGAGESAARPPVSRSEPARARSWRVVVLGRRVARGGRERKTKPSPTATNTSARTTVPAPEHRARPLVVSMHRNCSCSQRAILRAVRRISSHSPVYYPRTMHIGPLYTFRSDTFPESLSSRGRISRANGK